MPVFGNIHSKAITHGITFQSLAGNPVQASPTLTKPVLPHIGRISLYSRGH